MFCTGFSGSWFDSQYEQIIHSSIEMTSMKLKYLTTKNQLKNNYLVILSAPILPLQLHKYSFK